MISKHLYTYNTFQDWTNDYRQVYVITPELVHDDDHQLKDLKNLQHIGTDVKRIDDDTHESEVTIEYIYDNNILIEQVKRHLFMDTTIHPFI